MKRRSINFASLMAISLASAACGDDQPGEDAGVDAGVSDRGAPLDLGFGPDASPGDADPGDCCVEALRAGPCQNAEPIVLGGGAAGPTLMGELLVHVVDGYESTPRMGVRVRLDAPERLEAMTDESGCVQFSGAVLRGTASISVFESGRSVVTIVGQARREITVSNVDPAAEPPFQVPPTASVSGIVTNLAVLTATALTASTSIARVADLRPITKNFSGGPPASPARAGYPSIPRARAYQGPLSPTNPEAINFDDVSRAFVPSEALGFWIDGGTEETDLTGARRQVRTHLGLYRSLRPGPDENLTGLEFELSIARDQTMSVRAGAIPNIFTNRLYLPFVSFPDDNGIIEMDTARPYLGPADVSVPALSGALEGAVYGALLIATGRSFPGPALRLVLRSPNPSIDFGNTPSPPRIELDARRLDFIIDQDGGSMVLVTITRNDQLLWLTRVLEPRRANFSLDLADVPVDLPDLLSGAGAEIQVTLFRFESGVSAHEVPWIISEMERRTVLFATDTLVTNF